MITQKAVQAQWGRMQSLGLIDTETKPEDIYLSDAYREGDRVFIVMAGNIWPAIVRSADWDEVYVNYTDSLFSESVHGGGKHSERDVRAYQRVRTETRSRR